MIRKLCLEALAIAVKDAQDRVREVTSNRGPRVDQYLESAGEPLGQPYCCSAVFCWFSEAAKKVGTTNPLLRTGYCPYMATFLVSKGLARKRNTDARPGDVIIYWIPAEKRYGHAGIVQENLGGGKLRVVEANTNTDGSPEGDGVYIKTRSVAGTKHIVGDMQNFVGNEATLMGVSLDLLKAHKDLSVRHKVRIDGTWWPGIDVERIDGKAFVGLTAFFKAVEGKILGGCELAKDGETLDITTKPV